MPTPAQPAAPASALEREVARYGDVSGYRGSRYAPAEAKAEVVVDFKARVRVKATIKVKVEAEVDVDVNG